MSSVSSSDGVQDVPVIIPTMATEALDSPTWQERSVFVGGLPETHRAGQMVFGMVKGLGSVTSIRNGSSGARNPHFTIISFQSASQARRCAEQLKTPSSLIPPGLQPSAVTLDHVEFARARVGRPFFPPGAALPPLPAHHNHNNNIRNSLPPPPSGPRTLPPFQPPPPPPTSLPSRPPVPLLANGQPIPPYGVGGTGNGFGSGNGHGHNGSGGPSPSPVLINPNFNGNGNGAQSYSRGREDSSTSSSYHGSPVGEDRAGSPAGPRGGMRSDTIPGVPTSRTPSSSNNNNTSTAAEIQITGPPSPTISNGTMRAFPPSPDKGSPPTLPTTQPSKPSSPIKLNGATPANGVVAPLPPSLFTPPTSAEDLASKLKLAEMKLAELTAQAKLAEGHLDLVKRAAKRKEGEQERELAVLRRELEGAKRSAVEMQMKAATTQRLVERIAREDDKIGLSLSLIENLAHRARVNPGPQGVLPPIPAGYDLSRLSSSSSPSRVSSTILSHLPSSTSNSHSSNSHSSSSRSNGTSSNKRHQDDRDRDRDEEDRPSSSSSRPSKHSRLSSSSNSASTPSTSSSSSTSVAKGGAGAGGMVREAAKREVEGGILGMVGKAFSFFSSSNGAATVRDVKMEEE